MHPLVIFLAAAASAPLPLRAAAAPPSVTSAFASYQPYRELRRGDWLALNRSLAPRDGEGAGHPMARPMDASASAPTAASPPPAPASEPAMPAHGHHPMPPDGGRP